MTASAHRTTPPSAAYAWPTTEALCYNAPRPQPSEARWIPKDDSLTPMELVVTNIDLERLEKLDQETRTKVANALDAVSTTVSKSGLRKAEKTQTDTGTLYTFAGNSILDLRVVLMKHEEHACVVAVLEPAYTLRDLLHPDDLPEGQVLCPVCKEATTLYKGCYNHHIASGQERPCPGSGTPITV